MPHDEFYHTPMETISDYSYSNANKYSQQDTTDMYRSRHTASRTQQRPDLGRAQSYAGVNDTYNIYRDPPVLNTKKSKGIAGFFGLGKKHKRDDSNPRATVSSPTTIGHHHHSKYSASAEHLHRTTPTSSPQLQLSFNQYDDMRLALPSFKSDTKPYKTSPNESMRFALPSPTSDAMRHVMPSPTSDAMRYNISPSSSSSPQYNESDFYFSDQHKESSSGGAFSPAPPRTAPTPTRSSFFANDESKRRPRADVSFTSSLPAFSSETVKSPRHLRNNSSQANNWLHQPPTRRPSFNHIGTAPQSPTLPKEESQSASSKSNKLQIESNSSRYARHRVLTAPSVDVRFSSTRSAPAAYHSNAQKEAAFENLLASGKTKRLQATSPFAQH